MYIYLSIYLSLSPAQRRDGLAMGGDGRGAYASPSPLPQGSRRRLGSQWPAFWWGGLAGWQAWQSGKPGRLASLAGWQAGKLAGWQAG